MKLNGIFGKGSGKVGSSVFAISGGEQIVRQYNPQVSNPSTDAQVAQRAKLKLMSQLAADMSRGIAFAKMGLKSARNRFISKNFGLADYDGSKAAVDYTLLQLTDGSIPMEEIEKGIDQSVKLKAVDTLDLDYVVYVFAKEDGESQLQVVSVNSLQDNQTRLFEQTYAGYTDVKHVWAYGLKFNSSSAKINYENYYLEGNDGQAYLGHNIGEAIAGATKTTTVYLSLE